EQARLRFKPAPKPEPPAGPTLRPPAPSLPLPSADPTDPLVDILIDEPAPEPSAASGPTLTSDLRPPTSNPEPPASDLRPPTSHLPPPAPHDSSLQTTSTPEHLDRALRRLDEQARLALEEQGVNTLFLALGMLHYADEAGPLRAPLLLVPARLERKSARTGYTLQAGDDEPLVNPALAEYLRRLHGLSLPELPDPGDGDGDVDLAAWFQAVGVAIAGPAQAAWRVADEIYLGLFSFQKFVMYKDLEANNSALQQHRLVRQLVARGAPEARGEGASAADAAEPGGPPTAGYAPLITNLQLPPEILALDLDHAFPPENSAQVVDADGSQLRAIVASARGYDLVVEGPPGTGKSQTITNLIAQALGAGKSVLFVAEKMAALEVVYRRLVAAGLGEFCLELHSTRANKGAVIQSLKSALDASLQRPVPANGDDPAAPRLPPVRAVLTEYARAVHAPHAALEVSPYRANGELGAVLGAPRLRLALEAEAVTRAQLDQALRALDDLAAAAGPVGAPAAHPWRDTTRAFYTEDDLDAVRDLAERLQIRVADLGQRAAAVQAVLSLPPPRTLGDIDAAVTIGEALAASPGVPLAVLRDPAWNAPPPAALALIAHGRNIGELWARARQHYTPQVLEFDHRGDIAYVQQKARSALSFLAFLDARWRDIRQRWQGYRVPGYAPSLLAQAEDMQIVVQLQAERQALAAGDTQARHLFGALWQGESSNWEALDRYLRWVVDFRALLKQHVLTGRVLEIAAHPIPKLDSLEPLRAAVDLARQALASLGAAVGWPAGYLEAAPLDEIAARARALAASLPLAARWMAFQTARAAAAQTVAAEALAPALAGEVPFEQLNAAFRRAFWQRWLAAAVQARDPLRQFHTLTHEQRVAEFRALDEAVLRENRAALVARLRETVQRRLQAAEVAQVMPYLRRQMARQRGLAPLRQTLRQAEAAIRAIKPCFMMSPLTVAQLLDGRQPGFDLVIFDEASQLPSEDAVGAVLRGRQLVVVGDPKQLPPTNFFEVMNGQVSAPLGDDGQPLYEETESVLEEFLGAGLPASRLTWHYRSRHEGLIAFSNASFYDGGLNTFPSVETPGAGGNGVRFEFVPDGVYTGQGLNPAEARRVAEAVVGHARAYPALTLGVGTFNLRQQQAIQDELEQRRRADPSLEPFFAAREEGGFFVKNLENIQGDERDVIFISVTYARAADGRLRYNFGPLNAQNGWRRLNVLATRARQHMRVFASIRGGDIDAAAPSAGARLLRDFLLFAEHGRLNHPAAARAAERERPQVAFERDVYAELTRRGVQLARQVGVSSYRIDFAVLDPALPGRYVCGLECDGPAYCAATTARDRDRRRQQVLEARGWTLHRIWSADWYKDRSGQIERLLGLIEAARAEALADAEVESASPFVAARAEPSAETGSEPEDTLPHARLDSAAHVPGSTQPPTHPAGLSRPHPGPDDYQRPAVAAYRFAPGEGRLVGRDLLDAPASQLQNAVARVVAAEAPVHLEDLVARVAGLWAVRAGSRIRARILDAAQSAAAEGRLVLRGDFAWQPDNAWHPDAALAVRSRAGTRIPAERIAPEEVRAAVLRILGAGYGFPRPALVNEVRALFGYGRASDTLTAAVEAALAALLAEGVVGEGSAGLTLRS
ncbi:MAG: DUF3320 domain-containing protein, partial [Anaerolineales bacterium]|nr:DUF3320 domain-containing protein [Anaerolineales bacterium]